MKEWFGFAVAWVLLKSLGLLPRRFARAVAAFTAALLLAMLPKFRRIAMFNLRMAFPDWPDERREATIQNMARYLGWQAVDKVALRQAPLTYRHRPPRPKIDDGAAAAIAAQMTGIADERLRTALGRLGAAIKRT